MNLDDWLTQPGGLADRLRAVRTQAGLSGKEMAAALGWPSSRVSKLENGRQRPTADDIHAWVRVGKADQAVLNELIELVGEADEVHRDWRRRLRRDTTQAQADYNRLVADTTTIRHFETVWIPGLLQTRDYAHAVMVEMSALNDWDQGDVDTAVMTRLQRQQLLYDSTKSFEFLLWEPVLGTLAAACTPEVLTAQLDRLLTAMDLPTVRLGILPLWKPTPTTPQNSFQIYDDLVLVETFGSESSITGEEAAKYQRVNRMLWDEAVEGSLARQIIRDAIETLQRSHSSGQ